MAAPTPVQATSANFSATRSPSITFSTSPLEDDVIVLFIASGTSAVPTTPTGWENVLGASTDVESDSNSASMIAHAVTAAEDTADTVTWTLTNYFSTTETGNTTAVVLRGVDITDLVDDSSSGFSSANTATPHVLPAVTPTVDDGIVVAGVAKDTLGSHTEPAGWTIQAAVTDFTTGTSLLTYDTATTATVDVGPTNITPNAGDEYVAIAAVFKPAASAATVDATIASAWSGLTGAVTATVEHPVTVASAWGGLTGALTAVVTKFPTIDSAWGGLDGELAPGVIHSVVVLSEWGGLTGAADFDALAPAVEAVIDSAWSGLTGALAATVEHPVTIGSEWGALEGATDLIVEHAAVVAAAWGGLEGTLVADTVVIVAVASSWGGLEGAAEFTVEGGAATVSLEVVSEWGALAGAIAATVVHELELQSQWGGLTGHMQGAGPRRARLTALGVRTMPNRRQRAQSTFLTRATR